MPAADCHAHVFDPSRFPYVPGVGYHPRPDEAGEAEAFVATLDAHGMTHALLVQPSGYGTDNRAMLDALRRWPGRLRGIAVVLPDVADGDLADLAAAGVVGVRFNLTDADPRALEGAGVGRLLARVRELGWVVQLHAEGEPLVAALGSLRRSGCRLVVDHAGRPDPRAGLRQPAFAALLALGRESDALVKLSAPFRLSEGPLYSEMDPYVAALLEAFTPDRCVWGSDWPFIRTATRPAYGPLLACAARWLPEDAARRRVLWETPARVFGFC